ncbi:DUF5615 family PIN-like protein [Thermus tengchongensis]|uniref:DUF5615 domain-containing protein n=1 Tax=Thermus tengchongensis TaxID=1214928 RepID=A0ABY2K592_9DEIN|nr:hypothetical protein E0489_12420 [Thermus tengchongensis]
MKLLADEGVDAPIVGRLRGEGHEVLYVAEMRPGIKDPEVLALAREEGALLLTTDKDFVAWALRERRAEIVGAFSVPNGKRLRIRR